MSKSKRKSRRRETFDKAPIRSKTPSNQACFEVIDSSTHNLPAIFLIQGALPRDPQSQAARLAEQFIRQNQGVLETFDVSVNLIYDGNTVDLVFRTRTKIGALPLLSPTTGRPDYGLVIKPRFDWPGLGAMLATMGWRVTPTPLKLPLLPRSERKIPPWVLSTIILFRLKALLDALSRQFTIAETELSAPRGQVQWSAYATTRLPSAQFLRVPCRFPELSDDQELKSAIHYALRKQLAGLESQRTAGVAVLQLIDLCQSLLKRVQNVSPRQPTPLALEGWHRNSFKTEIFENGLQAVEWTIEDRGLAGLADLQGITWIMPMEMFFEAWVETIAEKLSRQIGGVLRSGRKRETVMPLKWNPPYMGSQRYLLPDIVIEREDETIIIDAKYKSHWEELSRHKWYNSSETFQEQHRGDLLQILAYSSPATTKRIVACLGYPCQKETWQSLKERKRLWHRASLYAGPGQIDVVLIALPMASNIDEVVQELKEAVTANP